MYYVFVDFDGVLTSSRVAFAQPQDSYPMWSTFDPVVMEFFNKIHNTFEDVEFVWTTSWRNNIENNYMTEHWAYSMWYNAGFRGNFAKQWRVNDENDSSLYGSRALEVKQYLEKFPADDFVVFDDTNYNYN